MSFSHIIQTEDDYQISDSQSLQLIIQTANPVKLSTFQCENLSIFIEYNHKYFRGFLDYVHYKQLLNSLSHLQLKSFAWKHGVNNQFSDEDAESLAAFIRSQKCLDTLNLSFDQNNKLTAKGIRSLLSAIAELNLKHLSLVFDDEIQLNLEDLQLIYRIQLLSLNLSFGQEVCSNQSWHQLKPQMPNLQQLSLLIRPYNKLDKSFSIYLSSLKTHSQLQHLNVTISSGTDMDEASIKSLSEVLNEMQNLQSLSFFLHDTRQFTQDVFDQLSSSFKQLNNLNLNLGNNHHIKSYDKLYDSLQNIHKIQFKFGQNYNLISSKLFQSNKMKIIDIKLQKGSQVQIGSFKAVGEVFAKAQKVRIEFADGKDCADLELIDLIGQVSKQSDVKVFSENKLVRMIDQTLQIQLDQIPSIKVLFNTLYSKLEFLQNLKISIKSTLIEQESIDQIVKQLQQSDLKVLSITIKRLNNFQCNQIIEFFAQLVQVKQWAFLSIEIANKCILQLYGKSTVNQQVNLQIHTGLKLGQSGLDNISKALKAINVTKLRLTILQSFLQTRNENQLSEFGIKCVSTALLYSTNLSKITFQILDTNPSVSQYVGKAQATINQYIKDKSKLQKTYSSLLQREWEQHKTEISAQMLQGISDYLIDDIQLPAIPAGQYHNQQYGFGSSWNPQSIIDIFDQ